MNGLPGLLEQAACAPRTPLDLDEIRRRARRRRAKRRTRVSAMVLVVAVSTSVAIVVGVLYRASSTKPASGGTPFRTTETLHYRLQGLRSLTFEYPGSWTATEFRYPPGIPAAYDYRAAVYLSNHALQYPCNTTPTQVIPGGSRYGIGCGQPLNTLLPGGQYVEWQEAAGGQAASVDRAGPPPSTLHAHGHEIVVQVTRGGLCRSARKLPADITILASILDRYGYRTAVYSMIACLRGPHDAKAEAQVRTMLTSAQVDD